MNEYKLCRLSKKKMIMSVDDLYYVLFYHWIFDDSIFSDEQQWNQVFINLLMTAYFDCRSISIFNTRLKLEDDENAIKFDERIKIHSDLNDSNDNQETSDSNKDVAMNSDWDEEQATLVNLNLNADSDNDDDDSTDYDSESDDDIDDDFNKSLEKTKSLLWRHITFIIVLNSISEKLNNLFIKIMLIHIKKEDNRSQE